MDQWSFSRLKRYEECPLAIKFRYIDGIKEPEPPANSPAHRGSRVHDEAEQFVKGKLKKQSIEMSRHFEDKFNELRDLYKDKYVELEHECGIDRDWQYVDSWPESWLILKIDAEVAEGTEGRCIDYKTGKRRNNMVKHGEQVQLYQTVMFAKYPQLERIVTELWYLDEGHSETMKFTRKQGEKFIRGFKDRATKMCADTTYEPNPNNYSCRFCMYGPGKTYNGEKKMGLCGVGIEVYP